jgi:hypothetical protein
MIAIQRPSTLDAHFRLAVSLAGLAGSVVPLGGKISSSSAASPAVAVKDVLVCDHYKRAGHDKDHCWDLHPELAAVSKKKVPKN